MANRDHESVISVRDLSTRINGNWVHRGLSLDVRRGEIFAVIGGSGAGKTVLLRHLVGLSRPVAGTVRVLGMPVHDISLETARKLGRRLGILFQKGALFSAMTVFENVAFPIREMRQEGEHMDDESLRELVFLKLDMVGISHSDAWKFPAELSGGMNKRVALARALALEAELLFLDEPTASLDPVRAAEFDELLADLRRDLGLSVMMITHDLASLAALSDRVAVLADGRVITTGTLEEVAEYDDPFVRRFFHRRPGEDRLRSIPTY